MGVQTWFIGSTNRNVEPLDVLTEFRENVLVSTIAPQIIELVKSRPAEEQQAVRIALAGQPAVRVRPQRRQLPRLADGSYFNPAGIPNDDPIFQILEQIEDERHRDPGPPAPAFD
jgi:hypothetical protein